VRTGWAGRVTFPSPAPAVEPPPAVDTPTLTLTRSSQENA
jgi:hypothetical protein